MRGTAAALVLAWATLACADEVAAPPDPDPVVEPEPIPDEVILAAGDIADCDTQGDEQTASLIASQEGTVLTLGDNAYPDGAPSDFNDCYDPSWGAHRSRTHPSPGNHDYQTADASGYFNYFGASAGDPSLGYYSFEVGTWHVVSLNSNISMSAGSDQEQWLRADLAASSAQCTLAYWHHPRFSSGHHGNDIRSSDVVQALYELSADVVLTGHDHNYERFMPLDPSGGPDPDGVVHFVAGTGGRSLRSIGTLQSTSAAAKDDSWGVLKLTLGEGSYGYEFLPVEGGAPFDVGSGTCR